MAAVTGRRAGLRGASGARLVREPQPLQDEPVEIQVERQVVARRGLVGVEAEAPLAPQQHAVEDAQQRPRARPAPPAPAWPPRPRSASRRCGPVRPGAAARAPAPPPRRWRDRGARAARRCAPRGRWCGRTRAGRDRRTRPRSRARSRARRRRARAPAGRGARQLEPPGGLRELEQLQQLGGLEPREVALQRGAHRGPQRTSPTTPPRAAASPFITRRLYQPRATTWTTAATNSTPMAVVVSGASRCGPRHLHRVQQHEERDQPHHHDAAQAPEQRGADGHGPDEQVQAGAAEEQDGVAQQGGGQDPGRG